MQSIKAFYYPGQLKSGQSCDCVPYEQILMFNQVILMNTDLKICYAYLACFWGEEVL